MKTEFDILCDLSNLENDNNSKKYHVLFLSQWLS